MKAGNNDLKTICFIVLISVLPLVSIYLPFVLHLNSFWGIPLKESGMQQIFANWDGPNFVYNAITFYDPSQVTSHPFDNKPASYYAAHLPGYPFLIRIAAVFAGFFWGAFIVNLISNVLVNFTFYAFIKKHTKHAFFLTFAFTVFPARFWIVRSVISPEMLMLACIMGVLYFWQKEKYLLSGVCGFLGVLLKFQMIVFIPALIFVIGEQYIKTKSLKLPQLIPPLLILTGFLLLNTFYAFTIGRWDTYFVAQSISGLEMSIPLGMFNYANKWVGTGWTEHIALYMVAVVLLVVKLSQSTIRLHFWFAVCYGILLSITPHLDIIRYTMPLAPLFFLAFHETLSNKVFRVGLIASLPILYLSSINFIMTNQAPITDWSLFR